MNVRRSLSWLPLTMLIAACGPTLPPRPQPVDIPIAPAATADDQRPQAQSSPPEEDTSPPAEDKARGPQNGDTLGRDKRSSRAPRQRALLVTEIQQLEALLNATGTTAPDRPQILRRLAEDFVELERASIAADRDADATAARAKAISYYDAIQQNYPNYPALDEVCFYEGLEQEHAHDLQAARKSYYELIKSHPASVFVPNAYLAFGEMFFDEGQSDPSKLDLALQAYQEVLKYPPPKNQVYGYALYKLGWTYFSKANYPQAMSCFHRAVEFGAQFSQIPGATKLADAARKDLVSSYAMAGDPVNAYDFFRTMSGTTDPAGAYAMMATLGEAYADQGKFTEARAVYKDLESRDSAHQCKWDAHARYAERAASGGASKADLAADVARCPGA